MLPWEEAKTADDFFKVFNRSYYGRYVGTGGSNPLSVTILTFLTLCGANVYIHPADAVAVRVHQVTRVNRTNAVGCASQQDVSWQQGVKG